MADQVLSSAAQAELLRIFEEVEMERLGPGKHDEYVKLVENMEDEIGIKAARAPANLR
jgi:hypothetical protein